jgi:hypothetical protein
MSKNTISLKHVAGTKKLAYFISIIENHTKSLTSQETMSGTPKKNDTTVLHTPVSKKQKLPEDKEIIVARKNLLKFLEGFVERHDTVSDTPGVVRSDESAGAIIFQHKGKKKVASALSLLRDIDDEDVEVLDENAEDGERP